MLIPALADLLYEPLHQLVSAYIIHPILVNFTAALLSVSVGSDILAKALGTPTLRDTRWWTLCFAAFITPFTALAGRPFWIPDDAGVLGMSIHKWLSTALAALVPALALWRCWFFKRNRNPSAVSNSRVRLA
jgi:uncharacterized membrane protein